MRRRQLFLGSSLLLTLPAAAKPPAVKSPGVEPQAAKTRTILAATPIARLDLPWWRDRHEAKLKELAATRPQLIFLGDSITQDWEQDGPQPWRDFAPIWQRFYGDRKAVNLGFKGDTTAN